MISQKLWFFVVSVVKFNLLAFVLLKDDWKMSWLCNLPVIMAKRMIGRLESRQTQRSVADAMGMERRAIAKLWTRVQETENVQRRSGLGHSCATAANNDKYIRITTRRDKRANATQIPRQFLLATGRRTSS